ncbi:MAG: YdcF family protein [Proteobacteria bacterium]|nr:YdcF family protein [Pseudomonadota bacterium]
MSSKEIFKNYSWFFITTILITFLILELIGVQQYGIEIYNMQKVQRVPENSEMIVVLAGSGGRLEAAYDLMKGNNIPRMFIAGTYNKVSFDQLSKTYHWSINDRDRIKIDNISTSTWENAKVSEEFAKQNNIKNIVLVTSIYHMQRAELLFRRVFKNDGVQITTYATSVQQLEYNAWWHDFNVFRKILNEYFKFQYYRVLFAGK